MDERVAQEALEALQLEKRLSLLSHGGRPGSGGRATAWAGGVAAAWARPAPKSTSKPSVLPLVIHSTPASPCHRHSLWPGRDWESSAVTRASW